jgi:hypothetical protein
MNWKKSRMLFLPSLRSLKDGCGPSVTCTGFWTKSYQLKRLLAARTTCEARCQTSEQSNKIFLSSSHGNAGSSEAKAKFVVSGLKPVEGLSDIDLFSRLCEKCLPVKPAIDSVHCRRLGKPQPGKVRRFLVALRDEESATELLRCAKMLKQSADGTGIYINPDLTQAVAWKNKFTDIRT